MAITFQQHILQEQVDFPERSYEIQWLLSGIVLASKVIQAQVRRAGLTNILGAHGGVNSQGETQQKLDVFANETLINCFSSRQSVGVIASEENEHPLAVNINSPNAQYAIVFDPLDGSSNIDVAVTIGTTFSIFRRPEDDSQAAAERWILQPGKKQVAAGYVVYGSSTVLVYSVGNGVHAFTLDPAVGSYILTHENIRIPERGNYYSINEAYLQKFPAGYGEFVNRLKKGFYQTAYSSRFIGSMVADFHRTLLRGGIFLYPQSDDYADGRLRLLYEANPIAFLAEHAGGMATDGVSKILDLTPRELHQRTPLIVGGKYEMEIFSQEFGRD